MIFLKFKFYDTKYINKPTASTYITNFQEYKVCLTMQRNNCINIAYIINVY